MQKEAPLKVSVVRKGSLAESADVQSGDSLISINGNLVQDVIDFYFYSAEEALDMLFDRNGSPFTVTLERSFGDDIGLEFEPMRYKYCGNHCVFCFVDQNPRNLRSSLYFKDEDFRLSFLYGNYVTLTNIHEAELARIAEQRLSPLYVSVHAINPDIRKKMLGLTNDDNLLEKIQYLTSHQIELHGQIVLCPGWNDGTILEETMDTLFRFFPEFRTLAVVPVGLTRHRDKLTNLAPVTPEFADEVITLVSAYQRKFEETCDEPFVYLADEFYLKAQRPLPPADHYREYWQIENGVGLTRDFLDTFDHVMQSAPDRMKKPMHWIWVSGVLAGPVLRENIIPRLSAIENLHVELCIAENHLMGSSVTVSGLLSGEDFYQALHPVASEAIVMLPPNCVNEDGLFLDNWTPARLSEALNCRVQIVDSLDALWKNT